MTFAPRRLQLSSPGSERGPQPKHLQTKLPPGAHAVLPKDVQTVRPITHGQGLGTHRLPPPVERGLLPDRPAAQAPEGLPFGQQPRGGARNKLIRLDVLILDDFLLRPPGRHFPMQSKSEAVPMGMGSSASPLASRKRRKVVPVPLLGRVAQVTRGKYRLTAFHNRPFQ